MPRFCPMLVALLAVLAATDGAAQSPEGTDYPIEPRTRLYGPMPLASNAGRDSVPDMSDDVLLEAVESQRRGEASRVAESASDGHGQGQEHGIRPPGDAMMLRMVTRY